MSLYTRVCSDCRDEKPLVRYPRRGTGRGPRCAACESSRRRARRNPRRDRDTRLRRDYGITLEQYNAMGRAQRWRCAICERPPRPCDGRLVVDHDHTSGRVRALLCAACNSALGLLGDKAARVESAAKYLREH